MGNFKNGDKVRINAVNHSQHGVQGTVSRVFEDGETYLVDLETGRTSGYFEKELELVDPEREALIRLAETLDKARIQANAIDIYVIQSQNGGVYGQISQALTDVLEQIVGDEDGNGVWEAGKVYQNLLDGNTVREALTWWEGQK